MKKLISILLAILLFVTSLPIAALADGIKEGVDNDINVGGVVPGAEDLDYVTAPGVAITTNNIVAEPRLSVYVPVKAEVAYAITTLSLKVEYPTDVFELVGVEKFNIGSKTENAGNNLGVNGPDMSVSPYRMDWAYINAVTYFGELATLKFNVKAGAKTGNYEVKFSVTETADTNGKDAVVYKEQSIFTSVVTVTDDKEKLDSKNAELVTWGNNKYQRVDGKDNGFYWLFDAGKKLVDYVDNDNNTQTYYVVDGVVDGEVNGLTYIDGVWYNLKENTVVYNTTPTVVSLDGTWYCVVNGKIDFNATTLVKYGNSWYYVQKGVLRWGVETLVNYYGTWYYVKNSTVDFGAKTLIYYGKTWYYVENGKINFKSAPTLCYYGGTYYYTENGKVNFNATTLVKYGNSWYYIQKGVLRWGVETLVNYYGTWYYVKNSTVDFGATTLFKYGNSWYYIQKGVLKWGVNTLVKYGKTWYYVENSQIKWNANLKFNYGGTYYTVKNGVVVF